MTSQLQDQEQNVSDAFSRQSVVFDDIYDNNVITLWMRNKARAQAMKYLQPGAQILELNCGTGIDSVFFAQQGYNVLATDNAEGMLHQLSGKISRSQLHEKISVHKCSFNNLQLPEQRQFDHVFSNFSGLNCAADLPGVLVNVGKVIKPGGYFTYVIMPRVCPWELAMLFKGRVKGAFRRFNKSGANAHIEGVYFKCYYYNPSVVIKSMGPSFTLCALKGLASFVPPPSMEYFPAKYPRLFNGLKRIENAVCDHFPFNRWCDQYVITMQKNGEQ